MVTGTPAARAIDSAVSISSLFRVSISHSAGPADAEGRQRRERRFGTKPVRAERGSHRGREIGHERRSSTAISARSCAMSAFIASPRVQTANVMVSSGASWPATAMSAAITVAIFG